MKTKTIFISLLLASAILLTNCSGNKKEEATESIDSAKVEASSETAEAGAPLFTVDAAFQQQLSGVFTAYVALKDAFVSSDAIKVKSQATTTKESLGKVDMKLLSGAAHNDWMNYLGAIEIALKAIEASTDIEVQRVAFSSLSDNLYRSIKAFGLGGQTAYYEFCPMAFNNQGGFWLSNEDKIRNPYFGDKMLTCGEVKEKLR